MKWLPVSIKHRLRTADGGLRTGYKTRIGYKTRTEYKMGTEFKIAVLTHKSKKLLLFQFPPALLSCRRPNLASLAV